jgi:Ser/Thr protein kinase RdoA (MazF antagonist)
VDTPAGSFLLQRFTGRPRREVLFQLEATAALSDAGLPVPMPIPARDGERLVESGQQRYGLSPWIDGGHRDGLDLRISECVELGGLLGRVHAELDALTPPVQQTLLSPATRVQDAVARADRLLAVTGAGPEGANPPAGQLLGERRDLLVRLADHQPPAAETVAAGHLHGDFQAANLLYGRFTGQVVAILDWDHLVVGSFAGELVRAATLLFGYGDERGFDLERVEAFVGGHASTFPLDASQLQSAVHRLWWERLCDLRFPELSGVDEDSAGEPPFPGGAALVEWWTGNLDRTLESFAAPYARGAG